MRSKEGKGKIQENGEEVGPLVRSTEHNYASMTMADYLDLHTITVPYDLKDVDAQIKNQFCAFTEEYENITSPMESEGKVDKGNGQGSLSGRVGYEE